MLTLHEVQYRLAEAGMHNRFWSMPEVRELPRILSEDEQIVCAVNGRYENGFAMLIATDRRLLLVDKKVFFLSLEDLRYDMIVEVDYSAQFIGASLAIMTLNKTLNFSTWRQHRLRKLTNYIQQRVMELRHSYQAQGQIEVSSTVQPPGLAQAVQTTLKVAEQAEQTAVSAQGYGSAVVRPFPATPLMMRRRVSRFPTGVASLASRGQTLNHNQNT